MCCCDQSFTRLSPGPYATYGAPHILHSLDRTGNLALQEKRLYHPYRWAPRRTFVFLALLRDVCEFPGGEGYLLRQFLAATVESWDVVLTGRTAGLPVASKVQIELNDGCAVFSVHPECVPESERV